MNVPEAVERMERSGAAIARLLEGLDEDAAHARPRVGAWSVVEVLGHLAEEEVRDFRARFDGAAHRPDEAWEPIDPEGWVVAHDYQALTLAEALDAFSAARAESLAWLRGLEHVDLDRAHDHPRLGRLRAGDLLASWVAHDLLHLRQLARLLHGSIGGPYSTAYAGPLA